MIFLKKTTIFLFLIAFYAFYAQEKKFLLIDIQTNKSFVRKDSLLAVKFLDSLVEKTYFFTEVKKVIKLDNITSIYFDKKQNYNKAYIVVQDNDVKKLLKNDYFFSNNLDSLKRTIHEQYKEEGFTFNRVKTTYLQIKNNYPEVKIEVSLQKKRKIDALVFKEYNRLPKAYIKNLEKNFLRKTYSSKTILALDKNLNNNPFFSLEKPPQTLFSRDSTEIYLFAKKKKSNFFDGILGFGNNQSDKIQLNGSVHLQFKNLLNGFEKVSIFWQRNPNSGQTFDLQTDIPYLFKKNFGLKGQVNIFRQDSTFAHVKIYPSFYYQFNNKHKVGLKGSFEVSSIFSASSNFGRDFNKKGTGIWYDFFDPTEIELFPYKTQIRVEGDYLSTIYNDVVSKQNQYRYLLFAETNIKLYKNNYINVKSESAILKTKDKLSYNELFRFGGGNNLRGFNENSLLADFYWYGGMEYRFLLNNQSFFDFFVQYGFINNSVSNLNTHLYSIGGGFQFFLPIGLMSFQVANGTFSGNAIRFDDTKVHWGIIVKF